MKHEALLGALEIGRLQSRETLKMRKPFFAPAGFCCFAQLASWEERWGHTCWLAFSKAQLRPSGNHCRGRSGKALFLAPNWFSCSPCCLWLHCFPALRLAVLTPCLSLASCTAPFPTANSLSLWSQTGLGDSESQNETEADSASGCDIPQRLPPVKSSAFLGPASIWLFILQSPLPLGT